MQEIHDTHGKLDAWVHIYNSIHQSSSILYINSILYNPTKNIVIKERLHNIRKLMRDGRLTSLDTIFSVVCILSDMKTRFIVTYVWKLQAAL